MCRSKQRRKKHSNLVLRTAAEDAETYQVWEWQHPEVSLPAPRMSHEGAQGHAETKISELVEVENHLQIKMGNIYLKIDFSQTPWKKYKSDGSLSTLCFQRKLKYSCFDVLERKKRFILPPKINTGSTTKFVSVLQIWNILAYLQQTT